MEQNDIEPSVLKRILNYTLKTMTKIQNYRPLIAVQEACLAEGELFFTRIPDPKVHVKCSENEYIYKLFRTMDILTKKIIVVL